MAVVNFSLAIAAVPDSKQLVAYFGRALLETSDCLLLHRLVSQACEVTADRGDFCLDLKSTAVRGSLDGAELQQQLFQVE